MLSEKRAAATGHVCRFRSHSPNFSKPLSARRVPLVTTCAQREVREFDSSCRVRDRDSAVHRVDRQNDEKDAKVYDLENRLRRLAKRI